MRMKLVTIMVVIVVDITCIVGMSAVGMGTEKRRLLLLRDRGG